MKRFSLPDDLMEEAYEAMRDYPDLTAEEVAIELLKQSIEAEKREVEEARELAIERLRKLSADALKFILKPIEWACKISDGMEEDDLPMEDTYRWYLVSSSTRGTDQYIEHLYRWAISLDNADRKARELMKQPDELKLA